MPTEIVDADLRRKRVDAVSKHGTIRKAIAEGAIEPTATLTVSEALVLGLIEQGVTTFVGVLGHGSTTLADELRAYAELNIVRFVAVRHETAAAHAASALNMATGQVAAVVTSIGPGALHAFAGSLTSASNGAGVWHIYGDATTEAEGPNMQDLPGSDQQGWQRLASTMGPAFSLHTPNALTSALQMGANAVHNPHQPGPFFMLLPLNMQPTVVVDFNLNRLPTVTDERSGRLGAAARRDIDDAARVITAGHRVVVKVGRGAQQHGTLIERLCTAAGAVAVLSPGSVGTLAAGSPHNMAVGGSKGTLSGNFAMESADTLVVLGSRSVCQADCSRTGYPGVSQVVNLNADLAAATHYNNTIALVGDLGPTLESLCEVVESLGSADTTSPSETQSWLGECRAKRAEWNHILAERTSPTLITDLRENRPLISQPTALATIESWAKSHGAIRFFDAGDVQATAFQVAADDSPDQSYTDAGASYMGFATSAVLASALDDRVPYSLAVVGDGSFLMNPQALIDGVVHRARGAIVILDNRRMGAISALQQAQYGYDWATSDDAEIDYVALASAVKGVTAVSGDGGAKALTAALDTVYGAAGLGLIHVPVYYGEDPRAGFDAYGRWNVGPWVADVQQLRHQLDL